VCAHLLLLDLLLLLLDLLLLLLDPKSDLNDLAIP
jgi:hypothetical protein